MAVLQHYYTSYVNRETGSAGFQVKAMSPGIGDDTQSTIARLISYRIPPRLDEYAIASHPVALRYFYRTPQEAILLCSQSNGTDENGRPGNFFAHSLVTAPDIFASMPPILYWRSPFWRAKDPGTRATLEPLNSIEEIDTAFDIDGVWNFLAQGNRTEQFYKLMSALVHCNSTQRRIVIIDSADNVAQWVAALTIMLPPDYRPLLTFATYHHDPYQSQFMVTGTSPDSSFRASPDEYRSYFILNAETGQISDVEDSPYAREATQAARSYDEYESRLLSLITDYTPRFPRPQRIDEQLDLLALYAAMVSPNQPHPFHLTSQELEAIQLALTSLEEDKRSFSEEDIHELEQLHYLLHGTHRSQDSEEVDREFRRSVILLRKHQIPTDDSALTEMKYVTQRLIVDSDLSIALQLLKSMKQTYSDDTFFRVINSAGYMQWLGQSVKDIDALQLGKVWMYLGVYFNPSQYSSQFIVSGLKRLGDLWNHRQAPQEAKALFGGIAQAFQGREEQWLQLIAANYVDLPEKILQRFYCRLVRDFTLDERERYRALVRRVEPDIEKAEMHYDITKAGVQKALAVLEGWVIYARQRRLASLPELMHEGLQHVFQDASPQQKPALAAQILTDQALAPLPVEWENTLVTRALSRVSLSRFDETALEMWKKYRTRQGITEETRTVMDGLLAMKSGELDEELAGRLQVRFRQMRQRGEDTGAETKSFVQAFLKVCTTNSSQQYMLNGIFFDWMDSDSFWQAYWNTFKELLAFGDPATAWQAMKLLAFWFVVGPENFHCPYLVPYFFMWLPEQLEAAGKSRGFQEATRVINARAEKEQWRWYPLVEDYFTGRKNALLRVGQSIIAAPFKKRPQDTEEGRRQAEREQQERAELEESISRLFSKRPREQHRRLFAEIYTWQKYELFWSIYWECFKSSCSSADRAQQVLDILAFWFDDAFATLQPQRKSYIPQQFFLALREALAEAQKERGFREFARGISSLEAQYERSKPGSYSWFFLVQNYFEEQEKKFSLFRR